MKKLKWAVLGSCGIAKRRTIPEGILPADNAQLTAVFDPDAEANAELAASTGAWAAASESELLSCEADAVYVATPAHLHHRQVLACAEAGKHVLCEKPLGLGNAEAVEMLEACSRAEVRLGVGFMMRLHAQHRTALDMIRKGDLGELVYGRAQLSCWFPPIEGSWRQDPALGGGGSLVDMGGHCIDLLEMFFGEVARVQCMIRNRVHAYASEDSAVALLEFQSGAMATVDTFFCIPDRSSTNRLELYGSRGSILAEGTIGQSEKGTMTAFLEEASNGYDAGQTSRADSAGLSIDPPPVNTYRAQIEEFSAAILDERPSLLECSIGLRSQQILSACYASARAGKAIELNERCRANFSARSIGEIPCGSIATNILRVAHGSCRVRRGG